jgi:hypothetical protein
MPEGTVAKKTKSRKSWVFLLGLGIAAFLAVKTGWAGFGWADLKSRLYPGNDGLLAWIPGDAQAVAIVDPHQIHPKALGSDKGAAREWLERVRSDVKNAAGVDLAFDVDKLAITPSLVVMSGRFDGEKLAAKLADYKYARAEHGGRSYLVRPGEDAVMAADDSHLLYGDEASIKAAIDAEGGASLAKNDLVVQRLARMGYKQPLVATVALGGERPSLRSMITGSTGPHAISIGLRSGGAKGEAAGGVDVHAIVETGSANAADELGRLLDEKRAGLAESLQGTTGVGLATLLGKVAHDATIKSDPLASQVGLDAHVPAETLDALIQAAETSVPLSQAYKTLRLYQMVAPGPLAPAAPPAPPAR